MNVTVFGAGYVGLVTAACLAEVGNNVICIDVDENKVKNLNAGIIPIFEPGLEELIHNNATAGRLFFSTNLEDGVGHGLFQFIAVGTPQDRDGSADLKYVLEVADNIGSYINEYRIIVDKSTVPVGTADTVTSVITSKLESRGIKLDFDVVSNPEFLKEGAAIEDFMKPDRVIVGTDNIRTAEFMKLLYAPYNRSRDRVIVMDVRSAELTKYAANAMLATKISFINELSNIAELTGADIEKVREGIGSDPRIGYHFIYPGAGYGGACFPKDIKALSNMALKYNYEPKLINSVEEVNTKQKQKIFSQLMKFFDGDLSGRRIALWGLSFKPNTDDMREAPSRVLIDALWDKEAIVRAYDPVAMKEAARIYGARSDLELCESAESALTGADALVIMTEWNLFRSPDFITIKKKLKMPVIFDGRNLYDPARMKEMGFVYYAIGRGIIGKDTNYVAN